MLNGRIVERGTYEELMANNGAFSKFVAEFGRQEEESKDEKIEVVEGDEVAKQTEKKRKAMVPGSSLMQDEERAVGAVSGSVYRSYFKRVALFFLQEIG